MLGRVVYLDENEKEEAILEQIGGLSCLCVKLPVKESVNARRQRRSLRRISRMFAACGVRRILMPEGTDCPAELKNWPMPGLRPFYRGIADLLAISALCEADISVTRATVNLRGDYVSYEMQQAARRLCSSVRGVGIDVPGDGARFADWLHREYGVPVWPTQETDLTLCFARAKEIGERVIDLSDHGRGLEEIGVTAPELFLPKGYEKQALAALWEQGMLDRAQIRVDWRKVNGISS